MKRRPEAWKERLRPYYLRGFYFRVQPEGRPRSFRSCWEQPSEPLARSPLSGAGGGERPSFLFLPMTEWHGRMQREQQLARALARSGHVCFYFNPHLGRQYSRLYILDPEARICRIEERLFELHVRLPSEPVFHHRLLTPAESERIAAELEPVAARAGRHAVVITSLPTWADLAAQLRSRYGWPVIYDCHDFLPGFERVHASVIQSEERLFRLADHVMFASDHLAEVCRRGWPELADRSSVLRNAADFGHFRSAAGSRDGRAQPQKAGYFGAIEDWFDIEAVRLAAEQNPGIRLELIGRVENPLARQLGKLPNVHLAGEVAYEELPRRLADFDIALLPFRDTPLTRAASPIKLYEYFASGIPVVARRLPELEGFEGMVALARSSAEFARLVSRTAAFDTPALREQRIRTAQRENWEQRAGTLARAAGLLLPQVRPVGASVI
jgi:glycosyltransferase involved in cell wall biosynthesis